MSKNTANIAQAISLLSDVLSREAADDLNDDKEIAYENYGDCMDATMGVSPGHVA